MKMTQLGSGLLVPSHITAPPPPLVTEAWRKSEMKNITRAAKELERHDIGMILWCRVCAQKAALADKSKDVGLVQMLKGVIRVMNDGTLRCKCKKRRAA